MWFGMIFTNYDAIYIGPIQPFEKDSIKNL